MPRNRQDRSPIRRIPLGAVTASSGGKSRIPSKGLSAERREAAVRRSMGRSTVVGRQMRKRSACSPRPRRGSRRGPISGNGRMRPVSHPLSKASAPASTATGAEPARASATSCCTRMQTTAPVSPMWKCRPTTVWHDEAPYQATPAPGTRRTILFREVRRMGASNILAPGTTRRRPRARPSTSSNSCCGLLYLSRSFRRRAADRQRESSTTREGRAESRPTNASSALAGTT